MTAACRIAAALLAIGGVFAARAAQAASPPSIVSAAATPARATVGDRITLTIVVDHDTVTTVEGAGFGADTGAFEIVHVALPRTEQHAGQSRTTIAYTITAFRTGDLTIPPQSLTYSGPDGSDTLLTSSLDVTITSVLAPGEAELRPLKPQLNIAEPAPPAVVPALFVAALAAMTAFGYVLMRRAFAIRPAGAGIIAPAAVALALEEEARAALDAIAVSDLGSADVAEYYTRIAATVRAYLSARFAFPAYAMTRSELERGAERAGIDRWPARVIGNLLEQCDAVEFAAFRPAPERRAADLTAAYAVIELTTRQEIAP